MPKKTGAEWVMVRITREVHSSLRAVAARMMRDSGDTSARRRVQVDRFGLSISSVVAELIRRDELHAARAKRSAQKRREQRQGSVRQETDSAEQPSSVA